MNRTFILEVRRAGWVTYDDEIESIADGNERLRFIREADPVRQYRLVEVLS